MAADPNEARDVNKDVLTKYDVNLGRSLVDLIFLDVQGNLPDAVVYVGVGPVPRGDVEDPAMWLEIGPEGLDGGGGGRAVDV